MADSQLQENPGVRAKQKTLRSAQQARSSAEALAQHGSFAARLWSALLALQKSLQTPVFAIGALNALAMLLTSSLSIFLVRILVKAEYGEMIFFYAHFGLLRLLINFGLGVGISRDVAAAWPNKEGASKVVYSSGLVRLLSILATMLLVALCAALIQIPFLFYVALASALATFADFTFAVIAGARSVWRIGVMTVAQPLAYFGLVVGLGVSGQASSESLMLGYAAAFALMGLGGLALLASSGVLQLPRGRFIDRGYLRRLLLAMTPVYLINLASSAWILLGNGAFGWLGMFDFSAEFGIAYTLVSLPASIISATMLTAFFPQSSHLYASGQREKLTAYIRDTLSLLIKPLLWGMIGLFAFAEPIINTLFGAQYLDSAKALLIMTPVAFTASLLPVFTLSLVAIGRNWLALWSLSAQLASMIAIVLLARNNISLETMAWAVAISALIGFLAQVVLAWRALGSNLLDTGSWALLLAAAPLALALRFQASMLGTAVTPWHFALALLFTAIYFVVLSATGKIKWRTAQI